MLVLPVILILALAIDVVRQPPGQRRPRLAAWPRALWIALGAGVAALLVAFIVKPDLTNYAILAHHVGLGHVLKITAQHALSSILTFAVIPIAVVGAMMSRAANWRDDRSGPVLTVLAAAVIVLYHLYAGCAGLMVGWWRQGIGRTGAMLAAAVAIGIPLALLWGMRLVRGVARHQNAVRRETQFFVDTKPIELAVADAARATRAPALRLASWTFILFRREVFSLTFFRNSAANPRDDEMPNLQVSVPGQLVMSTKAPAPASPSPIACRAL